jgi:hypothetical protein
MIAGKIVVRAESQSKYEAVAARFADDPVHGDMALLTAMQAGQL